MDDFIARNKGPLIAFGGAAGGLLVIIIISAWINMPEDINVGQIIVNLIWIILGGLLLVAGFLYLRKRFDGRFLETEEDSEEVIIQRPLYDHSGDPRPATHQPSRAETLEKKTSKALGEVEALFGTADMEQITGSVKTMYTELFELRALVRSSQATSLPEKESQITKLTSELEKAQVVNARWETKAISSTQEVAKLRQEIKKHGKWRPLNDEQLGEFFPTVTIRDGESETAFIDSKRRQRRLTQRLSAEGYSIVCPVK